MLIDLAYFITGLGLVTKTDSTTENNNLFFAEYVVLSEIKGEKADRSFFVRDMSLKCLDVGLYERRAGDHKTNKRTVSHDEISGWLVSSYLLKTAHGKFIWERIKMSYGGYDAHNNRAYPFNPGNFYLWGELVSAKYSKLFFPFFLINFLIAIFKGENDTSSKLIYFIELYALKDSGIVTKFMWNLFRLRMKAQYGNLWVQRLFDIYHGANCDRHPLIALSRGVVL